MSEMIVMRDSEIVAAEINTIKEDTRRIMIANAIRIGGKLTEAKTLVPFGEWGKWLEEKVEYSQSTAEDLMKLYREYGDDQESLFDNWTKTETFGKLSYSKHLALLALPFAQRQAFAEMVGAEELSTRELQKAVQQELEAERKRSGDLERALTDSQEDNEVLRGNLDELRGDMRDLDGKLGEAREAEKAALEQVEKLKKQVESAKKKELKAREDLQKAQENPQIPENVMEEMRQQVAAEAAEKATEGLARQLEEAQKKAAAAEAEKKAAWEAAKNAQEKLAAAERAARMQNPDVAVFQALYIQLQETWNRAVGAFNKVRQVDETSAANCKKALEAAIRKFDSDIG